MGAEHIFFIIRKSVGLTAPIVPAHMFWYRSLYNYFQSSLEIIIDIQNRKRNTQKVARICGELFS
jgi:hypothetical protein